MRHETESKGSFSAMQGLTPEENLRKRALELFNATPIQVHVRHALLLSGVDLAAGPPSWMERGTITSALFTEWRALDRELAYSHPNYDNVRTMAAKAGLALYSLAVQCGFDLDEAMREALRGQEG